MVNREIGDNEITLENRTLPWEATLSINQKTTVNERNQYYTYANFADANFTLPSVYSKENPLNISGSGIYHLNTNPSVDVTYSPPFTGSWNASEFNSWPCCSNYLRPPLLPVESSQITVFPNPSSAHHLNIEFNESVAGDIDIQIYNLLGKSIYKHKTQLNKNTHLNVELPTQIAFGIYLLKIKTNEKLFTHKINIQ